MQYHPHAATPAAASTSTKMKSKTLFKLASRIPSACISLRVLHFWRGLPPVQILLQDQSCSHGVNAQLWIFFFSLLAGSCVNGSTLLFFEQALCFPAR